MPNWSYSEKDIRDDVKLELPKEWALRVFEVTSGDTGKKYWVQILSKTWAQTIADSYNGSPTGSKERNITISLCDCPAGKFQAPLSVLGLKPCCKHAENLLAFLKEKKS